MLRWLEKNSWIASMISVLIGIVIFYISSQNFGVGTKGTNIVAIIYHYIIFFSFSLFLLIASIKGKYEKKHLFFIVLIIAIIYATLDEIHQGFVPNRGPSFSDVMLDFSGVLTASLIYLVFLVWRKNVPTRTMRKRE